MSRSPSFAILTRSFAHFSSYLPFMHIGMEYIQLNDMPMALDALETALGFGVEDPILFNEIGIVHFNQGQ